MRGMTCNEWQHIKYFGSMIILLELTNVGLLILTVEWCIISYIADVRKGGDFKISWRKMFLLKSCILSHSNCKNGKVQHLHMQTACVTVIFKTLGLIRLSRFLSYTNHESTKFQSLHLQLHGNTTHSKGLIASARLLGWLALLRCFYLGITWT